MRNYTMDLCRSNAVERRLLSCCGSNRCGQTDRSDVISRQFGVRMCRSILELTATSTLRNHVSRVVSCGANEKMIRANTRRIVARVKHHSIDWDRPMRKHPCESIRIVRHASNREFSTNAWSTSQPAWTKLWTMFWNRPVFGHFRPKPRNGWLIRVNAEDYRMRHGAPPAWRATPTHAPRIASTGPSFHAAV